MIMTNIPRRKIYETMLIYEEGLIDLQILIFSKENFEKFKDRFHKKEVPKINETYPMIKALMLMFLENKKYPLDTSFQKDLKELVLREKEVSKKLLENKNINSELKSTIKKLDQDIPIKKIKTHKEAQEKFKDLDKFNSLIPKFLEIRRDSLK